MVKPAQKREVVDYLVSEHNYGIRQACRSVKLRTSSYYYKSHPREDRAIIDQLNKIAQEHPSYGFPKMRWMLKRAGFRWNHKRIYRVYKEMGLNISRKRKRRLPVRERQALVVPKASNEVWSMDFTHDALFNNRKFRTLNIIDDYNREVIWIEVALSIGARHLTSLLEYLINEQGKPKAIRVDNGPEFTSVCFEQWCHKHRIEIKFIQPGKPVQNAFIERFNRSYRSDVLDKYRFESIQDAREKTYQWIEHYNNERPHESLGNWSPKQYLLKEDKSANPTSPNGLNSRSTEQKHHHKK